MAFCVKCGKKGIKGSLCADCAREENPVLKEFKEMTIEVCRICSAYPMQNRWNNARSVKDAVETAAKAGIKKPCKIRAVFPKPIEDLKKERGKKHIQLEISFPGEKYDIPADLIFTECPRCAKQRSTYFEAILQLRNPKPEIIDFIERRIEHKKESGIFLTDMKEVRNGIDFYITSKKYAMHLGRLLQKKFFGIYKASPQLFTRDKNTQKDVYRVNVLFKAFDAKPGDIIRMGEEEIKLLEARGERIQGMNMKTRKKVFVNENDVR